MTKIEDTLIGAVATVRSFVTCSVADGVPIEHLGALPTLEDLAALVAWVTAALPVVEAVRELQKVAKAAANQNSTLASRAEARKRMPAIVADLLAVVVPGNEP